MSDGQIRLRLKSGRFVRLRHGVYRVQGAPSTWEQTLLAACLSTGGVVSHHTACRLHESAAVASDQLTITVWNPQTLSSFAFPVTVVAQTGGVRKPK